MENPAATERVTRSSARRARSAIQQERAAKRRRTALQQRAARLAETPQLRALPAVLRSGFLYQYECMVAASSCRNWCAIWKEEEDSLPDGSRVQISFKDITGRGGTASWITPDLEAALGGPEFARRVFDAVNALRVAAKSSRSLRAKAQKALPVWGIDVQWVRVDVWGPNNHNSGGVALSMGKAGRLSDRIWPMVRLDRELRLWTGIRTWRVYDGRPLWP
jgi:hypothetical protein